MRSNSITHRVIIIIFALALLTFYGIGCGGSSEDDTPADPLTDQPTDQPTDGPTDPPEPPAATVSYSADIQPSFTANCSSAGCHGANPPSGLELVSYASLSAGGRSGPAFVGGDSANSLIVKRLEGVGGQRMPLGRGPLGDDQIQDVKDWIDDGGEDN